MNGKKVSILMNCYNGEAYLKEAIDSVIKQTYIDWEIIFIDNCSTDNSAKIAVSYGEKIKYYKTEKNTSLCEARIFSKPFIEGKYFCILDTDDIWLPTKLQKQVDFMEAHKEIGLIYTNTVHLNDKTKEEFQRYNHVMPSGNIFADVLSNYFFSVETVMIRTSILNSNKIFFNQHYNIANDAELLIKISYYTQCYYMDEILAKWRYGHGSTSDKHLCSFPKEYETLLKDLASSIENFNQNYSSSISKLQSKINNMYGLCSWQKGKKIEAMSFFSKATIRHIKYIIPLLLCSIINYSTYLEFRKRLKKI